MAPAVPVPAGQGRGATQQRTGVRAAAPLRERRDGAAVPAGRARPRDAAAAVLRTRGGNPVGRAAGLCRRGQPRVGASRDGRRAVAPIGRCLAVRRSGGGDVRRGLPRHPRADPAERRRAPLPGHRAEPVARRRPAHPEQPRSRRLSRVLRPRPRPALPDPRPRRRDLLDPPDRIAGADRRRHRGGRLSAGRGRARPGRRGGGRLGAGVAVHPGSHRRRGRGDPGLDRPRLQHPLRLQRVLGIPGDRGCALRDGCLHDRGAGCRPARVAGALVAGRTVPRGAALARHEVRVDDGGAGAGAGRPGPRPARADGAPIAPVAGARCPGDRDAVAGRAELRRVVRVLPVDLGRAVAGGALRRDGPDQCPLSAGGRPGAALRSGVRPGRLRARAGGRGAGCLADVAARRRGAARGVEAAVVFPASRDLGCVPPVVGGRLAGAARDRRLDAVGLPSRGTRAGGRRRGRRAWAWCLALSGVAFTVVAVWVQDGVLVASTRDGLSGSCSGSAAVTRSGRRPRPTSGSPMGSPSP